MKNGSIPNPVRGYRQVLTALIASHRLAVASRAIAAIAGSYVLTTALSIFLARVLPMPPAEAVMTALLLSFLIYAAAVLWVFAARSALRAWLGLALPAVVFGMLAWVLGRGVMP